MQTIYIIGAGTMGRGIAQVAAQAGNITYLSDISRDIAEKNLEIVKAGLAKQIEKGKMTVEEVDGILGRIRCVEKYNQVGEADFVIEAALEDISLKQKIFEELDAAVKPEAILATNTTSCSITQIASATTAPIARVTSLEKA